MIASLIPILAPYALKGVVFIAGWISGFIHHKVTAKKPMSFTQSSGTL